MSEAGDPLFFSDEWYSLGLVTAEKHQELLAQFERGEDRNPEHYRWRTFCDFIERNERLSEDIIRRLYRLGESDPDSAMGDSMLAKIIWRSDCPEDVLNGAAQDISRKHLAKIVQRRK